MNTALHLALALCLFYVVNWLGAHSRSFGYLQLSVALRTDEAPAFNFFLKTLSPTVFVVLCSTALYLAHLDNLVISIWQTACFYWIIRLALNLLLARRLLINWPALALQAFISISLSYVVYISWILPKTALFPSVEDLSTELWLAVILFIYSAINNLRFGSGAAERRKQRYVLSVLAVLRPKYNSAVIENLPKFELRIIAYAIMIHENFNRPALARGLERSLGQGWVKTFGLMQIGSASPLSDAESVKLGLERIKRSYLAHLGPDGEVYWDSGARKIVADFNRDTEYVDEVLELAEFLIKREILADLAPASAESAE